jgi:eukaryotic translation initiation factor 2C
VVDCLTRLNRYAVLYGRNTILESIWVQKESMEWCDKIVWKFAFFRKFMSGLKLNRFIAVVEALILLRRCTVLRINKRHFFAALSVYYSSMSNQRYGYSASGGGRTQPRVNSDQRRDSYGSFSGDAGRDRERNYDERRKNNFGGRGGGGFGGRGEGGAKHMGEHASIVGILEARQFSDASCLEIIAPLDTDRDDMISGGNQHAPNTRTLPALLPWRLDTPAGVQLAPGDHSRASQHTLRSNFFRVAASAIPDVIFHYNVSIFRYKRSNNEQVVLGDEPEDLASKSDKYLNVSVLTTTLAALDGHWQETGVSFGIAYDGNSSLYTTRKMPLPNTFDANGTLSDAYNVNHQFQHDVMAGARPLYAVVLRYVKSICPPKAAWAGQTAGAPGGAATLLDHREALQAMDVALLAFARKNLDQGRWFLSGNTIFSARDSKTYPLNEYFEGRLGYHASFRSSLSGLALVKDISVTCFLRGGNLLQFIVTALNCREHELARVLQAGGRKVDHLVALLKSCAVRLTHLNMRKKFRSLGPAANDPHSAFAVDDDQPPVTVAEYYRSKYQRALHSPALPTVDVGTRHRPILIPMELLEIVPGQTRQRSITGDVSAQIIKHAAMRPNDRFRALTQGSFLFPALRDDEDAQHFGLANIVGTSAASSASSTTSARPPAPADALPMRVMGTILPPAKLQYGEGRQIEPKLRGAWNLAGGYRFAHPAPAMHRDLTAFGALAVCAHENDFERGYNALNGMTLKLQTESRKLGVPMEHRHGVRVVVHHTVDLDEVLASLKALGVRIVVVLLMDDSFYARVKYVADGMCLLTQCMRHSVVTKMPRNYETSLLIKMNAKMGGTNHTLAARGLVRRGEDEGVFQQPPRSISWVFDVPAMVVGIDVNHPDPHAVGGSYGGSGADASVVAVVASMDGMLSQYCAHISACTASREPVNTLYDSFVRLLQVFCERNRGEFPRHIIVYRDGVADSQFVSTLDSELVALQQAIENFGKDEDFVKIAFVVCQKRHHTRFFYKPADGEEYLNPCVGLCVDARGFAGVAPSALPTGPDAAGCVVGSDLVEFYLNSHAAVLGTSKPTRYVLLYDGIGFKLSELELLTFWLTHLYARCTRSVSIVAPAYYAHWAARRGRVLLTGSGGEINSAKLKTISGNWLNSSEPSGMYFI